MDLEDKCIEKHQQDAMFLKRLLHNISLHIHSEWIGKKLHVFCFERATYDIKFMTSCLILIYGNDREIEM